MGHVISVDPRQMLFVDGIDTGTHLTRSEEGVLRAVLAHSHCATKESILSALYGGRDEPELKIIDVFITKVRAKLGEHRDAIQTVWGRGYARNPEYSMAPSEGQVVTVGCDAKMLEETAFAAGEPPQNLINRLLRAEHNRLWSSAAA